MAYDEFLADRIRHKFKELGVSFVDKKMMGGICFLVDDKMCVGIVKEKMMARIDPDKTEEAFTRKGCHEMDFTHRPMKGFIFVEPEGVDQDKDLEYFIRLALAYNPMAKSSKKKVKGD
ncbi:MAG: TfoX/Sxy family protein [Bacteroidetes bacterium]|nr:TfoX/Sxy family protein [Bacteroidota bacterium]